MATVPPTPDEAKALISDPTSSLCGNFVKTLLRLPVLFHQLILSLVNADGSFKNIVQTGDYIFAATATENDDRLLCNGQEVSKTEFADLYAAIGDVFGTPAIGTNFVLPDWRGRFPRGVGNVTIDTVALAITNGGTGGSPKDQSVTLAANHIPPHQHKLGVEDNNATQGESTTPDDGYKYLKVDEGVNLYWAAVPEQTTIYKASVDPNQAVDAQVAVPLPFQHAPWIGSYVFIKT